MTIDIISYTDEQFAQLTAEQLLEVRSAQLKKNRLDRQLEKDKLKEKYRLIENGIFLSPLWEQYCQQLQIEHDEEVEAIRDALLFFLRFSNKPPMEDVEESPYEVDYSLPEDERAIIVREYYESAYTNGQERFDAFVADSVAKQYLGEWYATLYDYFLEASKA